MKIIIYIYIFICLFFVLCRPHIDMQYEKKECIFEIIKTNEIYSEICINGHTYYYIWKWGFSPRFTDDGKPYKCELKCQTGQK